jgi:amino acid transporter
MLPFWLALLKLIRHPVYALGELAVMYPVSGGFYTYSARFIDPSWGFAMGWNYVFQWAIVLPLELVVAGFTVQYWEGAKSTSVAVYITVFWVFIILINVFGTLGYAEEEFWSSCLKLAATIIFMIIALVCVLGGGPSNGKYNEYYGARNWYDPGAFNNGFKGFCSVFVTAAFAFSGTELVGLAAAETKNPLKSLPGAIRQIFWRVTLFYVLGLFFVGLLVKYDDERLLGAAGGNSNTSPFVIASKDAGLKGFDSFMNVVILVSVVSIGVSGVYGGSRTLTALADQGYAPKIFAYIDRSGRPLWSVVFILAWGGLGYMRLAATGTTVFSWLVALSGLAALFTWGSICLSHIRFRKAWAYHGHTLDEIPFKAAGGVAGSWLGIAIIVVVLIAQVSLCPGIFFNPTYTNPETVLHCRLASRPPARCQDWYRLRFLPGVPRPLHRRRLLGGRLLLEARGLAHNRPDGRRHGPSRARLGSDQPRARGDQAHACVEAHSAPPLLDATCAASLLDGVAVPFLRSMRVGRVCVRRFHSPGPVAVCAS